LLYSNTPIMIARKTMIVVGMRIFFMVITLSGL